MTTKVEHRTFAGHFYTSLLSFLCSGSGSVLFKVVHISKPPMPMSSFDGAGGGCRMRCPLWATCGRVSAEYSLFPYYTVDKIHDGHTTTGPRTAMHVTKGGRTYLWEPFVLEPAVFKTRRNLYKNKLGNLLVYGQGFPRDCTISSFVFS